MPSRNLVYEALALRARESPAGDRILTLMTAEAGLVDVFVFGGPKSRLRSLASPYAAGRAFVYLDPVKDFRKLSDFEVRESWPALRDELDRLWAAGLVAELLLKTSGGGGDFAQVLELSLDCLAALDRAEAGMADRPLVLFLWRLVALLGLGPDPGSCAWCGSALASAAARGGAEYSSAAEGFLCPACRERRDRAASSSWPESGEVRQGPSIILDAPALRWLALALEASWAQALASCPAGGSLAAARSLAYALARRAADYPLSSFARGAALT